MSIRLRAGVALSTLPLAMLALPGFAATNATPAQQDFSGYSTGTDVHLDLVQSGTTQVANAEVAYSGATVASQGTGGVTQGAAPLSKANLVVNEMGQTVQPKLPTTTPKLTGDRSYGRGSGLEVGLGTTIPSSTPTIPVSKVEVSAPGANSADSNLLQVPADPLANATAVRGTAAANWNDSSCILGKPISQGMGYVANAQLLDTVGNTTPLVNTTSSQGGGVSTAASQTFLDQATTSDAKPASNAQGLALVSQTREVIAPVTLFGGTPNEVTIEVAPLTLQAVAGGVAGTSYIRYTPDPGTGPNTPIVRISGPGTGSSTPFELTTQQVLGETGLTIPASPLATVTVGTVPHAIGSPDKKPEVASNGTSASAAVDAVSVHLLTPDPTTHLSDIRIGHMEARAQVPAGGISCSIPVTKVATPGSVTAGQTFTYTIGVKNPFDCTLSNIHVVDNIATTPGVKYTVVSTKPSSTTSGGNTTFGKVADLKPHTGENLTMTVKILANSASGRLTDTVHVSGTCGNGTATGTGATTLTGTATGVAGSGQIPLGGTISLQAPSVSAAAPATLPRTG